MKSNRTLMMERFHKVKALGYVKSNRRNNTGIGKTFEDYVGVVENNLEAPDFAGYEIKSHRDNSQSYITLFTKAPSFPRGANSLLKDQFGICYENNPDLKKLFSSMFATRFTDSDIYPTSFRLINDRARREVRIGVYNLTSKELIDDTVGYTYEAIEKKLSQKLKNLFYVKADTKVEEGTELFYFNSAEIYSEPLLGNFLELLDDGKIMYDIRLGSYASGRNIGKAHDHGSGFRILEQNLALLYKTKEAVE